MNLNKCNEIHKIFLARAKQEKSGCIKCGRKITKSFYQKKTKEYMCLCLFHVSPMAGTPMHKSHVPLETWFELIKDIVTSDKGIDTKHVKIKYRLSNNTAWNVLYRIKDWLNLTEEKENCIQQSKFVKVVERFHGRYFLKFSKAISPRIMEKKMLESLPPLFEHLREPRIAV